MVSHSSTRCCIVGRLSDETKCDGCGCENGACASDGLIAKAAAAAALMAGFVFRRSAINSGVKAARSKPKMLDGVMGEGIVVEAVP